LIEYLNEFITAYINNLLIFSENELDYKKHIKKVLARLKEAELHANIKKSEFYITRTKYLRFIISTEGIKANPKKIKAVKYWNTPSTLKGVQSFLGFCNFY
jgi:hypothetical protein